jgi:hypothetical protein
VEGESKVGGARGRSKAAPKGGRMEDLLDHISFTANCKTIDVFFFVYTVTHKQGF